MSILIGLWRWLGKGNRKTGMILVLLGACAVMYTVSLPILGTIIGAAANLLLRRLGVRIPSSAPRLRTGRDDSRCGVFATSPINKDVGKKIPDTHT